MDQLNVDHIDLLKIDIEGTEKELFEQGAVEWLQYVSVQQPIAKREMESGSQLGGLLIHPRLRDCSAALYLPMRDITAEQVEAKST